MRSPQYSVCIAYADLILAATCFFKGVIGIPAAAKLSFSAFDRSFNHTLHDLLLTDQEYDNHRNDR